MANVLDLRRRIRSVKNTRQITKAMKMVSAAKLRRAQERALQSRPFAQMLTNVLQSVVSRAELYDPETGQPLHPLLRETRPEKTVLIIVVTGDRGLAGAFNSNVLKAPLRFTDYLHDKNIDVITVHSASPWTTSYGTRAYWSAQSGPLYSSRKKTSTFATINPTTA